MLTPQEQQELALLEQEELNYQSNIGRQPQGGLTPQEQAELKFLEKEEAEMQKVQVNELMQTTGDPTQSLEKMGFQFKETPSIGPLQTALEFFGRGLTYDNLAKLQAINEIQDAQNKTNPLMLISGKAKEVTDKTQQGTITPQDVLELEQYLNNPEIDAYLESQGFKLPERSVQDIEAENIRRQELGRSQNPLAATLGEIPGIATEAIATGGIAPTAKKAIPRLGQMAALGGAAGFLQRPTGEDTPYYTEEDTVQKRLQQAGLGAGLGPSLDVGFKGVGLLEESLAKYAPKISEFGKQKMRNILAVFTNMNPEILDRYTKRIVDINNAPSKKELARDINILVQDLVEDYNTKKLNKEQALQAFNELRDATKLDLDSAQRKLQIAFEGTKEELSEKADLTDITNTILDAKQELKEDIIAGSSRSFDALEKGQQLTLPEQRQAALLEQSYPKIKQRNDLLEQRRAIENQLTGIENNKGITLVGGPEDTNRAQLMNAIDEIDKQVKQITIDANNDLKNALPKGEKLQPGKPTLGVIYTSKNGETSIMLPGGGGRFARINDTSKINTDIQEGSIVKVVFSGTGGTRVAKSITEPDKVMIESRPILNIIEDQINDLYIRKPQMGDEGKAFGTLKKKAIKSLEQAKEDLAELGDNITPQELKKIIQSLDQDITFIEQKGVFSDPINAAMANIRKNLSENLKNKFPEFRRVMEDVNEKTQLLTSLNKHFRDEGATISKLKNITSSNNKPAKDSLIMLGDKIGINFDEIVDEAGRFRRLTKTPLGQMKLREGLPEYKEVKKLQQQLKKPNKKKLDNAIKELQDVEDQLRKVKAFITDKDVSPEKIEKQIESYISSKSNKEAFRKLGKLSTQDFVKVMDDVATREKFFKGATTGSRNVNLFMGTLLGIGGAASSIVTGALGATGAGILLTAGGAIGALVDKFGPRVAKGIIDGSVKLMNMKRQINRATIGQLKIPKESRDYLMQILIRPTIRKENKE